MFKDEQSKWHILFSILYVAVAACLMVSLVGEVGTPITTPLFDALLLAFATFRLTRLFVYDAITQCVRDMFLELRTVTNERGEEEIIREKPSSGPQRTLATLFGCPWCFAIWPATLLSYFYFLTPFSWFFIFVLALAGAASLLQLLGNLIGWSAEYRKRVVELEDKH